MDSNNSTFSTRGGQAPAPGRKIVFILGAPGCGKGTQARRLTQDFGYTRISVGDVLRTEIKKVHHTAQT